MGPARSGSGLHVDPLATSAWNALLVGHKRWALFPPGTQRRHVLPKLPGLEREAVSWFTHVYPLTQREDWPTTRPIDIIQVQSLPLPSPDPLTPCPCPRPDTGISRTDPQKVHHPPH